MSEPELLHQLPEVVRDGDPERLADYLATLDTRTMARQVCELADDEQVAMLSALEPAAAIEILGDIPAVQRIEAVSHLTPDVAAAILHELPSDAQADVVGALEEEEAEAILAAMEPAEAEQLAALVSYPPHTAGGLMATELVAFRDAATVRQVLRRFRQDASHFRSLDIQYAYVTDELRCLVGVLRFRDLLLAADDCTVMELMKPHPLSVSADTCLSDLQTLFDDHSFLGVPVVDDVGTLLGVVSRSAVDDAMQDQAASDYRRSLGLVREEVRSMPVWRRSRLRLAWLSINIVLNVLAASIIAFYQDTLSQVIALAVFLPIISDMSGCSGNQAVAVSMRELSLRLVEPSELLRVWLKEASVGLLNGVALGGLLGAIAWIFVGNPWLGAVVGLALAANTLIAVLIGGVLPLILKHRGVDPALASGPILTTVTDMVGFFLVLRLATWMLPWLVAA